VLGAVYWLMHYPSSDIRITGNHDILNSNLGVVLNSRQSKTPCGNDNWVQSSIAAVRYLIDKRSPVIASIGMNTWEMTLWAVSSLSGNCVILLPGDNESDFQTTCDSVIVDFNLNIEKCAFAQVKSDSHKRSSKNWWDERDKLAFDMAYEIIPVSIRDSGQWSGMLQSADLSCKKINDSFRVEYKEKGKVSNLAIEMPSCGIIHDWDFVTHWTKRAYGPFPSERPYDYYSAIVSSGDKYAHDAEAALVNIITTRKIYGSLGNVKGGNPAVSFTGLKPSDAVNLMTWRKRKVCYTFEPYGIAIRKEVALDAGIKPVRYIKRERNSPINNKHDIPDEFTQGYSKGQWWREDEHRYIGDLDLNILDTDDIRVLLPTEEVRERIKKLTKYEVVLI
jgi:hypothetical protein